jgi:hypothetical protein
LSVLSGDTVSIYTVLPGTWKWIYVIPFPGAGLLNRYSVNTAYSQYTVDTHLLKQYSEDTHLLKQYSVDTHLLKQYSVDTSLY